MIAYRNSVFDKIKSDDKYLLKFERKFADDAVGVISREIREWLKVHKFFPRTVTDDSDLYLRFNTSKDLVLFKLRWA